MNNFIDLEEGEIADDPPIRESSKVEVKTPPRQYRRHNNSHSPKVKKKKCKHISKLSPDIKISKKLSSNKKVSRSCTHHRSSFVERDEQIYKNKSSHRYAQRTVAQRSPPLKAIVSHSNSFSNIPLPPQNSVHADADNKVISLKSSFDDLLVFCKSVQAKSKNHPTSQFTSISMGNKESDYPARSKSPVRKDEKFNNRNENERLRNRNEDLCERFRTVKEDENFRNRKENENKVVTVPKGKTSKVSPDSTSKSIKKPLVVTAESDDEDEEELRRKALASCFKRNTVQKTIINFNQEKNKLQQVETTKNNIIQRVMPINSSSTKPEGSYSASNSDNYEVIDMDLDGDQSINEIQYFEDNTHAEPNTEYFKDITHAVPNTEYFEDIIHTVPNTEFFVVDASSNQPDIAQEYKNKVSNLKEIREVFQHNKKNDIEEILLKTDLFVIDTTPNQPVITQDYKNENFNSSETGMFQHNTKNNVDEGTLLKIEGIPFLSEKVKCSRDFKECKTNVNNFANHKNSIKVVSKLKTTFIGSNENNDSKSESLSFPADQTNTMSISKTVSLSTGTAHVPRERIVITLTNESSSDESQDEDMEHDATFASLEALISSARQMSNEKPEPEITKPVEAVSCLSKAQQQEYNKLKRIIAQKESFQTQQKAVHSSTDDLKSLEKNLIVALSTLQKEKRFLNTTRPEVVKKKKNFLRSQLAYQHVKEQLISTAKKKKADAQSYQKALGQLQALQNSVTKRVALISDLERECKRLGASVHGANYKPPSVTFPNANRIFKSVKKNPTANANL